MGRLALVASPAPRLFRVPVGMMQQGAPAWPLSGLTWRHRHRRRTRRPYTRSTSGLWTLGLQCRGWASAPDWLVEQSRSILIMTHGLPRVLMLTGSRQRRLRAAPRSSTSSSSLKTIFARSGLTGATPGMKTSPACVWPLPRRDERPGVVSEDPGQPGDTHQVHLVKGQALARCWPLMGSLGLET